MLVLSKLVAGYGGKRVLHGISLEVSSAQVVAIIGPNGAGKSTILKATCGQIPAWGGEIRFDGVVTNGSTASQNVTRGMLYAPQGSRVFHELTVMENLQIGAATLPGREARRRIAATLDEYPNLRRRIHQSAGTLSGGERQQLALARTLLVKPKLLMLDEPSLGLSPKDASRTLAQIRTISRDSGVAVLVVEQRVREVLKVCDWVYSIKLGETAFAGNATELRDNTAKLRELFL